MNGRANVRFLRRDQRGLSTVEYTVLLVLILAGAISLWKKLGGDVHDRLAKSAAEFSKVQIQSGAGIP